MSLRDSKKLVVQFVVTRRRRILGALVLATLVTGGLGARASWIAHRLLRSWSATTIRDKSGDVYRLAVGQVRLNFVLRRITVDSVVVSTNPAANALRARPLSTVNFMLRHCTISGVRLGTLARGDGLIADSFDCEGVDLSILVPRGAPLTDTPTPVAARAFVVLQQSVRLPSFAPRVRVARIEFPRTTLDARVERDAGADSRIHLQQLRWHMEGFAIDPDDSTAALRPLFSRRVELGATDFVTRRDSVTSIRVDSLVASLTDSTLDVHGIVYAPTVNDAAFARSRPFRRILVKTRIGHIAVRGVDVGAFLLGHGLRAKRVEVDSLRVALLSDRRLPANTSPSRRRTPQEWIADLGTSLSVDSLFLRHGQVVFRLQRADRDEPGLISFTRINAAAANVRHAVGDPTGAPMTLRATAWLQDVGRLDARFLVPLDAPRFAMTFSGSLGAMPAASFNAFVQETYPIRIARGEVESIRFAATVVNGSARGTIAARYSALSLAATRAGRTGMLARDGIVGGVARALASKAGNWMKVYSDNPDDARTRPRVGVIRHTFTSNETLPSFLWTSLREGLVGVIAR